MLERILVTFFPVVFLAFLFRLALRFRRRHIDIAGVPPIQRAPFLAGKFLLMVLWIAMVLHAWGLDWLWDAPALLGWAAVGLWIVGFALMFAGQWELGSSLRVGHPTESTTLRTGGLFHFSRNPMYLGLYATLLASVLHTLNPVLLLLAAFTIVVHHRIVLAEEAHLRGAFGEQYAAYCHHVPRYLW